MQNRLDQSIIKYNTFEMIKFSYKLMLGDFEGYDLSLGEE